MGDVQKAAEINGFPVYRGWVPLTEHTLEIRRKHGNPTRCPLCRQGWINHVPTNASLLMNNNQLFPNSLAHQGCIDHAGGIQAAAEKIAELYQEFKDAREKFREIGWWPRE